VDGVAGQVDAAHPIARRDHEMREPRIGDEHREIEVASRPISEHSRRIERARIDAFRKERMERPRIDVVLCDERSLERLPVPPRAPGLEDVAAVRMEVDRERAANVELALERDAEAGADTAPAAVAADEIVAT
jgi:hypothetical protein